MAILQSNWQKHTIKMQHQVSRIKIKIGHRSHYIQRRITCYICFKQVQSLIHDLYIYIDKTLCKGAENSIYWTQLGKHFLYGFFKHVLIKYVTLTLRNILYRKIVEYIHYYQSAVAWTRIKTILPFNDIRVAFNVTFFSH